jgi:hypothetical protein
MLAPSMFSLTWALLNNYWDDDLQLSSRKSVFCPLSIWIWRVIRSNLLSLIKFSRLYIMVQSVVSICHLIVCNLISLSKNSFSLFAFQDSSSETVILISPKFGISQINSLRNSVVSILILFPADISSSTILL